MRALLASPLGFLIGLSLGALGGGGSILAIPALVYAAGLAPREASATSLVLVSITAGVGVVPHWRAGRVRPVAGLVFGAAGIGGAVLGGLGAKGADADVLMLAFSGLMATSSVMMWRRTRPGRDPGAVSQPLPRDLGTAAKVLAAGTVVGLLTGFFGVGGGFVIVPVLVLALGFSMPDAAGTSLVVIIVNSLAALATRLHGGVLDWRATVPFVVASLGGVLAGSRLAGRRAPRELQRWFVVLLGLVTVYTAARSALAIW